MVVTVDKTRARERVDSGRESPRSARGGGVDSLMRVSLSGGMNKAVKPAMDISIRNAFQVQGTVGAKALGQPVVEITRRRPESKADVSSGWVPPESRKKSVVCLLPGSGWFATTVTFFGLWKYHCSLCLRP